MDIEAIKNYYGGLLIVQYKTKPKAQATVRLLAALPNGDGLLDQEMACFDLNTAVGVQLDILGRIVGVQREVYGLDLEHTFFSFTRYADTPDSVGFGRYTDNPYSTDLWLRYNNWAVYTLTDFELRTLIKLKIIFNNAYSSLKDLKEGLYAAFAGDIDVSEPSPYGEDIFNFTRYDGTPESYGFGLYTDDPYEGSIMRYSEYEVMKLDFYYKAIYTNAWAAAEFLGIVPKPMGVAYESHLI